MAYEMRQHAGLTQRELAKRMGTTQSAIARLEGGDVVPRLDLLDRLARATGVNLRLKSDTGNVDLGRTSTPGGREGRSLTGRDSV